MEKKLSWFDKLTMAITFAEANETETAQSYLTENRENRVEQTSSEDFFGNDLQPAEAHS